MKRINEIDGLRALSICWIAFAYHYMAVFDVEPPNKFLSIGCQYGYLGVEIFFLVSGFLMYYMRKSKNSETFSCFIVKRLMKLLPIAGISTCVVALLNVLMIISGLDVWETNTLLNFLFNLIGMQTSIYPALKSSGQTFNQPLWFISIIIVCYIMFYYIMKHSKNTKKLIGLCLAIAFASIWILLRYPMSNQLPVINTWTARGGLSFVIGILIGVIYNKPMSEKNRKRIIFCAVLAIIVWIGAAGISLKGYGDLRILGDIIITFAILASPAVLLLTLYSKIVKWILSNPIFVRIGKISFSIFVWHYPIQLCMLIWNKRLENSILFGTAKIWFVYFGITILISAISYWFIEIKLNCYIKKRIQDIIW